MEQVSGTLPPARFDQAGDGGSTVAHGFFNDAALLPTAAATADEDESGTADELGDKMAAEIVANMEALHQGKHESISGTVVIFICKVSFVKAKITNRTGHQRGGVMESPEMNRA